MNNCGSSAWLVPTNVDLDSRDMDVRDLTATSVSCKNLTVNGEPVSNVLTNIGSSTVGDTVFTGTVTADDFYTAGDLTALSVTSSFLSTGSITGSSLSLTGGATATSVSNTGTLSQTGAATFGTNITQSSGTAALKTVTATSLSVNGISVGAYTPTIGSSKSITQISLTTSEQQIIPSLSTGTGTWLISFSAQFQVNTNTASNTILVRLYTGSTVQQDFEQLVSSVSGFLTTTISGSFLVTLTSTQDVKITARLSQSATAASLASTSTKMNMVQTIRLA